MSLLYKLIQNHVFSETSIVNKFTGIAIGVLANARYSNNNIYIMSVYIFCQFIYIFFCQLDCGHRISVYNLYYSRFYSII